MTLSLNYNSISLLSAYLNLIKIGCLNMKWLKKRERMYYIVHFTCKAKHTSYWTFKRLKRAINFANTLDGSDGWFATSIVAINRAEYKKNR